MRSSSFSGITTACNSHRSLCLRSAIRVGTRTALVAAIVAICAGCAGICDLFLRRPADIPIGDYGPAIDYADRRVGCLMRDLDLPSFALALVDDQEVVWHNAYGLADMEAGTSATVDTIYKIGSVTKLFTALEVMDMVEDGLIDLDAPIETYLPGLFGPVSWPNAERISVRSLLAHRSGLPRNDTLPSYYWEGAPDVLGRKAQTLSEITPALDPGTRYKYSNLAYNLLGYLVEQVRGLTPPTAAVAAALPYHTRESIFLPLGMTSTGLGSQELLYGSEPSAPVAMGYAPVGRRNEPVDQYDIIELASGNAQSTILDLEIFVKSILEGTVGGLLSRETLESMYVPQYSSARDPQPNGLGWFTDDLTLGERMVFHSGGNQGFSAMVALAPGTRVGLAMVSNSSEAESAMTEVATDLLGLMIQTKTGIRPPETPALPAATELPEERLTAFEGTFIADGVPVRLFVERGKLRLGYNGATVALVPTGQTTFKPALPVRSLGDVELAFFVEDPDLPEIMVLTLGGSFHLVCPGYPAAPAAAIPQLWSEVTGTYSVHLRHPSTYSTEYDLGLVEIYEEEGMLLTSDGKAVVPVSETEIRIIGGVFDGELMSRSTTSGEITWQDRVYVP